MKSSGLLKQEKLDNLSLTQKEKLKGFFDVLISDPNHITAPRMSQWNSLLSKYKELEKINRQDLVARTKHHYPILEADIESKYTDGIFILKRGALEAYTGTDHAEMDQVIAFCGDSFSSWLDSGTNESKEILSIINLISE